MIDTIKCDDGKVRCKWSTSTKEYMDYHDNEWGYPEYNDYHLFEKICLEGFQAGLSWRTILSKRNNFRKVFKGFDYEKVSKFTGKNVEKLLENEGIIRHRGKIEATINNAKKAKFIVKEFGSLSDYFWSFKPKKIRKDYKVVSTSVESILLAKDLKKRGWKFVGPTTAYAFMQAMGLVNDHGKNCYIRKKVQKEML